jgi:transposase
VKTCKLYSAAEVERMMKLQDVLLKAMAKRITWWSAAEIIGVSDRTMRRWRERMEVDGYSGLADRRKGKASDKRVPLATVETVLGLYRETYYDLNMRHFHEKLSEVHGIQLSYTWVQKALREPGWWHGAASGVSTGGDGSRGRCRACCCTLTEASMSGFVMSAGTT